MHRFFNNKVRIENLWTTLIVLFVLINLAFSLLSSRPVSDDYCTALIATKYGFLQGTLLYLKAWSFSLSSMPVLLLWKIGFNSQISSILITSAGVGIGTILLFKWIPINSVKHKLFILSIFPLSMTIVRFADFVYVYPFKYSYLFNIVPGVVSKSFTLNNLDNQLYLWWVGTPIVAFKTVNIAFLILGLYASTKSKTRIVIFCSAYFIFYGVNLETLIYFMYLFILAVRLWYVSRAKSLCYIVIGSLFSLLILNSLSGTANRVQRTHILHFQDGTRNLIIVTAYLIGMYLLIGLLFIILRILIPETFQSIRNDLYIYRQNINLLVFSSLICTALFGSFVYLSSYHWLIYAFFAMLSHFANTNASSKGNSLFIAGVVSSWLLVISIISLSVGTATLEKRAHLWDQRMLENVESKVKSYRQIEFTNSFGAVLAYDLSNRSSSIVPGSGFMSNHTSYCYSRLPKSW